MDKLELFVKGLHPKSQFLGWGECVYEDNKGREVKARGALVITSIGQEWAWVDDKKRGLTNVLPSCFMPDQKDI